VLLESHIPATLVAVIKRLLVLAAAALALAPTAAAGLTRPEASILREMNRVRTAIGLKPLRVDPHLQSAAHAYSVQMMRQNIFTHGAFPQRMAQFHVSGVMTGENIAWGTGPNGTARGLVEAWMKSPPHRANLLRPNFTRVGVGAASGTYMGWTGATVSTTDFAA
jgi:uncharacterized protein YkwD